METNNNNSSKNYSGYEPTRNNTGRIMAGLIVIIVGLALLAKQMHFFYLPHWVFSWKMLLIVIGLYTGFKHNFRNIGWIFPFGIGALFLMEDIYPTLNIRPYFWPVLLIGFGLYMMLRPRHHSHSPGKGWKSPTQPLPGAGAGSAYASSYAATASAEPLDPSTVSKDDFINGTAVFGGIKKSIITKSFKGGQITTFCGGAEYNLTNADLQNETVIDVNIMFGGTSLVIPADWKVRSEVVCIFGGIDEKRSMIQPTMQGEKVLILKGTVIFGGIDIKSY
ncbi:hypothetical protein TH61_08590 [Rufibacter sp. DG15C]|uniref:LiaF transmembrane domain-containing protein n=1 Tax=Rufibacter sp. DG15C TaxID=1379909 RepID=UPI00078E85F2|nr:DUF5668 domain-containing protein [Rufibacter sp. DG15C]AMM51221.1 hypothetical protein TH61_08590 [Rufibacter sp. DG15C]